MSYILQPFRRITKDDRKEYGKKEHYPNSVLKSVNLFNMFPQSSMIPKKLSKKYGFNPSKVRMWGIRKNSITNSVCKKVAIAWKDGDAIEVYFCLDKPVNAYFHGKLISPIIELPQGIDTSHIWPVHNFDVHYDYIYFIEKISEYTPIIQLNSSDIGGNKVPDVVRSITFIS